MGCDWSPWGPCGTPLGPLWPRWHALGCLWYSLGRLGVLFRPLTGSLGAAWGALGRLLMTFGRRLKVTWGAFWDPLGSLVGALGCFRCLGVLSWILMKIKDLVSEDVCMYAARSEFFGAHPRISRISRMSWKCDMARCMEPPFYTHKGQDDGSYTNSLKLLII